MSIWYVNLSVLRIIAFIHFDEFTETTMCMALLELAQSRAGPQHNQTAFYNHSLMILP